jgi:hypothetical protein
MLAGGAMALVRTSEEMAVDPHGGEVHRIR